MSEQITHPPESMLADFIAGQLERPLRVVIETHLALCPTCTAIVADLGALGSQYLASAPPARPQGATWARIAAQLDQPDPTQLYPLDAAARAELGVAAGARPQALRWRRLPFSHGRVAVLLGEREDEEVLLIGRVAPGRLFPRHRHLGVESVVVLEGGYVDPDGHFGVGSFFEYPAGSEHGPRADDDGPCTVLARLERGVRFTGLCGLALALRRAAVRV